MLVLQSSKDNVSKGCQRLGGSNTGGAGAGTVAGDGTAAGAGTVAVL